MNDQSCIEFLQWCLPKMRYQWKGFRKVRKQVCKRIHRRLTELEVPDLLSYRDHLENNKEEWEILDSLCNITISRFFRNKKLFDALQNEILPILIESVSKRDKNEIRCWSIGCCSGEEPYSLQILWNLKILPGLKKNIILYITATDRKSKMLERAKLGIYPKGSLKELPEDLLDQAFMIHTNGYLLKDHLKKDIEFFEQDIRKQHPNGKFDLIFCRNLVFTYFDKELQVEIYNNIIEKLRPNGFLIIGAHESLPIEIKSLGS